MKLILVILIAIYCIEAQYSSRCQASTCDGCVNPNCVWCDNRCLSKNLKIGCDVRITDKSQCQAINPCATVLCMEGTICVVDDNGNPNCVPNDNSAACAAVTCLEGTTCVVDENGNPSCVSNENPCNLVDCLSEMVCIVNDDGEAQCVANACMTVKCTAGHTCITQSDGTAACVANCDYNGVEYNHGDSFPSDDGCNSCSCNDGTVVCTLIFCEPNGCDYNGNTYEDGASFPSSDGCNTCTCNDGSVACTKRACVPKTCRKNSDCTSGQYCAKTTCSASSGQCNPKPELCLTLHDPVCGCDGKTYSNSCAASNAGVNVRRDGEC